MTFLLRFEIDRINSKALVSIFVTRLKISAKVKARHSLRECDPEQKKEKKKKVDRTTRLLLDSLPSCLNSHENTIDSSDTLISLRVITISRKQSINQVLGVCCKFTFFVCGTDLVKNFECNLNVNNFNAIKYHYWVKSCVFMTRRHS